MLKKKPNFSELVDVIYPDRGSALRKVVKGVDAATSVGKPGCAGLDGFGYISIFDTQVLRDSFQRGDERSGLNKR